MGTGQGRPGAPAARFCVGDRVIVRGRDKATIATVYPPQWSEKMSRWKDCFYIVRYDTLRFGPYGCVLDRFQTEPYLAPLDPEAQKKVAG